jgi:hypothetical protein
MSRSKLKLIHNDDDDDAFQMKFFICHFTVLFIHIEMRKEGRERDGAEMIR